ncbi:hypothetical protein DFH09DRAFT_1176511 [Mycena vulgaris]|nr:hypothetical protein DFH09DRAFT_1176511 [Mycena vulgaris]
MIGNHRLSLMDHILTLDDLRVKSCFICLEEEHAPASNTALWVHPCPNCALIAHDKCLIRWISSLPLRKRHSKNGPAHTIFVLDTFKCPHCGCPYELANPRPPRLHWLGMIYDTLYVIVSELGEIACALVGVATLQSIPIALTVQSRVSVLSGMFIYELLFLESYLGPHMFSLLLTDKPSNFLRSLFIVVPTIPFRLLLPGTMPKWIILLYLSIPPILHAMIDLGTLMPLDNQPGLDSQLKVSNATRHMVSTWPPSPALLGLAIVPLIRPVYNRLFSRFQVWVLGSSPPHRSRRYLTDRMRGALTFGARRRPPPPTIDLQDGDPMPIVIADQIIQKDQSSCTHDVLHAILIVGVPRLFGNLLLAASGYSPYLRRFLGLRPPPTLPRDVYTYYPNWVGMTVQQRTFTASKAVGGLLLGGSWIWADMDPVWWRNSLGYGLFIIAKDCFELYRLWLQQHEVQSRTIKSRDFTGVDVAELDLISPERFT